MHDYLRILIEIFTKLYLAHVMVVINERETVSRQSGKSKVIVSLKNLHLKSWILTGLELTATFNTEHNI